MVMQLLASAADTAAAAADDDDDAGLRLSQLIILIDSFIKLLAINGQLRQATEKSIG